MVEPSVRVNETVVLTTFEVDDELLETESGVVDTAGRSRGVSINTSRTVKK